MTEFIDRQIERYKTQHNEQTEAGLPSYEVIDVKDYLVLLRALKEAREALEEMLNCSGQEQQEEAMAMATKALATIDALGK